MWFASVQGAYAVPDHIPPDVFEAKPGGYLYADYPGVFDDFGPDGLTIEAWVYFDNRPGDHDAEEGAYWFVLGKPGSYFSLSKGGRLRTKRTWIGRTARSGCSSGQKDSMMTRAGAHGVSPAAESNATFFHSAVGYILAFRLCRRQPTLETIGFSTSDCLQPPALPTRSLLPIHHSWSEGLCISRCPGVSGGISLRTWRVTSTKYTYPADCGTDEIGNKAARPATFDVTTAP